MKTVGVILVAALAAAGAVGRAEGLSAQAASVRRALHVSGLDGWLVCDSPGGWTFSEETKTVAPGVEELTIVLENAAEAVPPEFKVEWSLPQRDIPHFWHVAQGGDCGIPPDWGGDCVSSLTRCAPVYSLFSAANENRLVTATDDAKRLVRFKAGLREETCTVECAWRFFTEKTVPSRKETVRIRFDTRRVFWSDAVRDAADWIVKSAGYVPLAVPDAARAPLYSAWYSFHQDVHAKDIEEECAVAASLGMKTLIVDDGWQTDDTNRGYDFCGDWEISKNRFPDMAAHVKKVHALGMKYMIWYSVPFVGVNAKAASVFKGKFLREPRKGAAGVLDPRFPEVREYLAGIYEKALREWDLDGLKLDFIDSFGSEPGVPEAVDTLMTDVARRLKAIKPEVLVEFRQSYIGPGIRKYGNMLRVSDCPGNIDRNRSGTAWLRLTSGDAAVHSDMLEWHPTDTAENAARFVLSAIFGTVQYSMMLRRLPESHLRMLRHWISFAEAHRQALQRGDFKVPYPQLGVPFLVGESDDERVIGVYCPDLAVDVGAPDRKAFVLNATQRPRLALRLAKPCEIVAYDTFGRETGRTSVPAAGLHEVDCPASGYLAIAFSRPSAAVDARTRTYVYPTRIVWQTQPEKAYGEPRFRVEKPELLLERKLGQIPEKGFWRPVGTRLVYVGEGIRPAILLDFGRELHGGVQLGVSCDAPREMRLRLRFGESVGEAMCELGEKGSSNDHALRDLELAVPSNGSIEVGNTGFRFLRVDLLTTGSVGFDFIRAVELLRPMRRLGAFKSSDERLNRVFETAVRTVHLCCQDRLWDGIKRDRLVWMGDLHPEFKSVLCVFGADPVLYETLDYARTTNPNCEWMNGIPTYTLCYLRDEYELYRADGDRRRLEERRDYLVRTTKRALSCLTASNTWETGGWAFLDWPSQHDKAGTKAGVNGAAALALGDAAELMDALGEGTLAASCRDAVRRLRLCRSEPGDCKQAGALLALGGIRAPQEMFANCLGRRGHAGVSTFFGYYMIEAMSAAGEQRRALDTVRDYWGAMNDMGATSYWENFDVAWTNGASRLDELPTPGKKDIHGDFGEFCYPGYRHSLCHGWSSGPAAWCIERVLGLRLAAPGGTVVAFDPDLGDLAWAEGAIALPHGRRVFVRVTRRPDGTYATQVDAPPGVTVIRKGRAARPQ